MRSTLSRGTALALLPALGMFVLAGCGDDSGSPGASPSTTPSSTPTSTAVTETPPVSTPPTTRGPKTNSPSNTADPSGEQADVTIDVRQGNGKVTPSGASVRVKAGQSVLVTGVSDVEDVLHVHGYDKEVELKPGKPASVRFTADMKGTFEIETHETGKLVAKLVVS